MPNWKSYDSSVRLLSAILAAHPELKLNYHEIAQCFGDNATRDSIEFRLRRVKTDAKAIREARANGVDPMSLDMDGGLCKNISKRFGGDCTVSALENRFRRIKNDAKALNDAVAKGIDPITIPTDGLNGKAGTEIAKYYEDCTASALDHRFRPIKKEAQAMRAGGGIADKFGEDVTAKAVSTRFERLKKEPHWDLANNMLANSAAGDGNGNAPSKPKATPRKKKAPAATTNNDDDDDDEDFDEKKPTPKKGNLNKTQGGRVTKPQTPKKNGSFNNMAAISVVSDDEDETSIIKPEPTGNGFSRNGNGHKFGQTFAKTDDADDDDGAGYYGGSAYGSEVDAV